MRKISVVLLLLINVAAGVLVWQARRHRSEAEATSAAVPPIPDLAGWPRVFVDRVRLDTSAAQGKGDRLGSIKELALLYHANGFAPQAERLERQIRALQPSDPAWAYYLADLRLTAGDVAEGETLLTETLRLQPDYAPALLKLGDLLLRLGRHPEAEALYRRRLGLYPNDPYAQLGLARIALQSGQTALAVSLLETLTQSSPRFGTAHNLLAELYRAQGAEQRALDHATRGSQSGRFREAEDPWLSRIAEWSYDPYRLQVLGATEMQTGHLDASLPFYEKSVQLNPKDGTAYDALADVYVQLNRLDDARKALEAGLAAAPETRELYTSLSQVLRKEQKPGDAIALLQRGLTILPGNPELYNDLGVALEDAGRRREAVNAYREAVRLNSTFAQAHLNLGLCLLQLGDDAGAQPSIRRALELRPSDATALLLLAQTELDAGRIDSAARFTDALRRFHPDMPELKHVTALIDLQRGTDAAKAGDTDGAERWLRAGLTEDEGVARLHANLGALLSQRGNYTEALPHFERFVALAPDEPMAYLYLGQVLLATERSAEAEKLFTRGLEIAQGRHDNETAGRLESLLARARQ